MAENRRPLPAKTAELKREHETHRPRVNVRPDAETSRVDIPTVFEYRNAVETVSEIAKRLEAVNGEGNAVATAAPGQVLVNDSPRPPMGANSCPDTAQQGDLGLQFEQLAGNLAANLVGLKVAGSLMKSATRQLSAGVQEFKAGMKGMKQGLSSFKVNGKDSS